MLRIVAVLLLLSLACPVEAQDGARAAGLEGVTITEHLGEALPLGARFVDQDGKSVTLGDLFDGERPALLVFAYHRCAILCDLVLSTMTRNISELDWTVGDQYDVVVISIDPKDTPESSREKLAHVLHGYGRTGSEKGFHFLTTRDDSVIHDVARSAGFGYTYDPVEDQYGHTAALMVVTPHGKMARYLYGMGYASEDVRLGLLEAADGGSLSTLERVIVYCYHYDPAGGRYTIVAENIMKIFAGVVALVLGTFLFVLWRRELRTRRASA